MANRHIPFIKPHFPSPEAISEDLKEIYANNYYSNNGPVYFRFKAAIEAYLQQGIHAVVVSNATLGLMLSIEAVFGGNIKPKRYIAIPSFTFAAGPLAIKWCGFEPLFFDIEADTTQPSLNSFQSIMERYGSEIAGVVLTNNFGIGSRDIDAWIAYLNDKNIAAIIDSAPGFGSTYADGSLLGGETTCEVFSFHATKPFGIGEGGLITTKDPELARRLESLKNFGFNEDKVTSGMGSNAKITELDCAIGLRILADYPARLESRRKTYGRYEQRLSASPDVTFLPDAHTAAIQFATIFVPAEARQKVLADLHSAGVEARTYYAPAVHTFPLFEDAKRVDLANTLDVSDRIISLPVHPDMSLVDVDYVCDTVLESLKGGLR